VYVAKIGFLVATIPYVRRLTKRIRVDLMATAFVGTTAIALAFLSQHLVDHQAVDQDNPEIVDLERVWSWMHNHATTRWGRIYVQDPIWVKSGYVLADSHLLAQTAEHAHVEQLGSYYGSNPYVKGWIGDGGSLFGLDAREPEFVDHVVSRMNTGNVTHLLLVDPRLSPRFEADPRFMIDVSVGRYVLLERRDAVVQWGRVLDGAGDLSVERIEPGRIHLASAGAPRSVAVNESFHPFWRVDPPDAGRMSQDSDGLIVVDRLSDAKRSFDLVYSPPTLPIHITQIGCLCIAGLFVAALTAKRNFRTRRTR
jgi:hypothetical protein